MRTASPTPHRDVTSAPLLVALALSGATCVELPLEFRCTRDVDCTLAGQPGRCEIVAGTLSGFCSRSDDGCESGRRYVSVAGVSLAGTCVPPPRCGQLGDPCCDGVECDSGLLTCADGICTARPCVDAIAAGSGFTCAHRVDGTLWCWGDNSVGQLGDGRQGELRAEPRPVLGPDGKGPLPNVDRVVCGTEFACALESSSRSIWCWGRNDAGQLGNGTTNQSSLPKQVLTAPGGTAFTGALDLVAGGRHACIFDNVDATVWCWGDNSFGQLGRGTTITTDPKTRVPGGVIVTASLFFKQATVLAAGSGHTCAVRNNDTTWCWGTNRLAELGIGSFVESRSAMPAQVVSGPVTQLVFVRTLGAGEHHTCAVKENFSVECWGAGAAKQLGMGTPAVERAHTPVVATAPGVAREVQGGASHTCALGQGDWQGKVFCWGANGQGQLGSGETSPGDETASEVQGLSDAIDLAVGSNHACAVRRDGTVWCWGANDSQQLGALKPDVSPRPIQVAIDCTP